MKTVSSDIIRGEKKETVILSIFRNNVKFRKFILKDV